MEALRSNRMEAYYVKTSEEAAALVKELIPEGSVCRVGGSRTLHETGIIELLENGNYYYRDSHVVPPGEVETARREAFFADFFLASANAITEDGEIYNVDGAGTRVAPIIFGPKNVILVAGTNKIVSDIAAALILADKSDVRRSRVRNSEEVAVDIHDRVNYSVTKSSLHVDREDSTLTLKLSIDESVGTVTDYFEIFLERMLMCRRAAQRLGLVFRLTINGIAMM